MRDYIVSYIVDVCIMAEDEEEAITFCRDRLLGEVDDAEFLQITDCGESAE